jgi:hypothetical protein
LAAKKKRALELCAESMREFWPKFAFGVEVEASEDHGELSH